MSRQCASRVYFGIDPGSQGALAKIGQEKGADDVIALPTEISKLKRIFARQVDCYGAENITVAVEEQRHWGSGDRMSGMKLTRFLRHYVEIVTTLKAMGVTVIEVPPTTWQGALLGPLAKGETKTAAIEYATRAVPHLAALVGLKSKGNADAMCLALYAKQAEKMLTERGR